MSWNYSYGPPPPPPPYNPYRHELNPQSYYRQSQCGLDHHLRHRWNPQPPQQSSSSNANALGLRQQTPPPPLPRIVQQTTYAAAVSIPTVSVALSTQVYQVPETTKMEQPKAKEREFSNILECPVCFSVPDNEVFNCEKGHSVCDACRKRLDRCALCSSPYSGSRNFVLESLVAHFKKFGLPLDGSKLAGSSSNGRLVSCKNKTDGCKALLPSSEMGAHEKECEYRPIRCKATIDHKCPWETFIKLSDYFKHLLCHHDINGLSDEKSGYFTKVDRLFMGFEITTSWPPFYMNFDGKNFLRFAELRHRKVSWWVQLIGPDNESRKYRAIISLHSPTKMETKISYSVPVHPIRANKNSIEQNNIASISSTQILPLCSLNEQFEDRVATHTWICNISLYRVD